MKQHAWVIDDALVRRCANFIDLTRDEQHELRTITQGSLRRFEARRDIIREYDRRRGVGVVMSGCACRYKTLDDGRRQILAFLVPGDMYGLSGCKFREMDHSIAAICPVVIAEIPYPLVDQMMTEHPRVAQCFSWHMMTVLAAQREFSVSLGQRVASERMAHVFCDLLHRLRAVGLAVGNSYAMPITQLDLSETLGLTSVHVNRTLQDMRSAGLVIFSNRFIEIPDVVRLEEHCFFSERLSVSSEET